MIDREPVIRVGIMERISRVQGLFKKPYAGPNGAPELGEFVAEAVARGVRVLRPDGTLIAEGPDLTMTASEGASFVLRNVTIGINFHWERKEDQEFAGSLRFIAHRDSSLTVINHIGVEAYLASVIASEMSATSPAALLRAHAITSRSWLVAMLEREQHEQAPGAVRGSVTPDEVVRWYDREDHADFDVCADDHCQRYQGVTKILSPEAMTAVRETRGQFLVHGGEVCDARFYKACGGMTEEFPNAWEDRDVPYLHSVSDARAQHSPVRTEADAERWIFSSPDAFCNTNDGNVLRQVLPSFDQETTDFFRWKVTYSPSQLADLIRSRSGYDLGPILDLVPLHRGPSGRITRLKIVGEKRTITVGKELEIRKWLSKSHLYSSAFIVKRETGVGGRPSAFTLHGAGWGHGVGLCQIGAAVMATKGYSPEQIVLHYFRGAKVERLY
ncbi:MAG: SpoIID/LytB domain-containing protein [Bacteroidetes bacterium]|jgi:SpoIID/LytB domain protein|nr:SpoIID/LytB domain-containing protein [Bacteroidota bacterium]